MANEEKENKGISRREFLKDASLLGVGTAVGTVSVLSACSSGSVTTVTQAVQTSTVTKTSNVTVTSPPVTTTVTVTQKPAGSLTLNVNGKNYDLLGIKDNWSLAYVIREKLGLTGTKRGCDTGDCGVCTLLMEGKPVLSCIVLAMEAGGKAIQTVEGLEKPGNILDPIQQAFVDNDAVQCGWCTGGTLMTAKALLTLKPKATEAEIREALAGNLCRCGVFQNVRTALLSLTK